mgnify:CR=1 FL=1
MDDSLFVHHFDTLNHLSRNMKYGLQIKFAMTFLEQVFETLSELVHYHDMEQLAALSLFVTNEVQIWDCRLAPELMDEL